MRNLYCPRDETELAYLRALLEGEEIEHFVHNDHFGTLNVGPRIRLFNEKTLMVDDEDHDRALELIREYIDLTADERPVAGWRDRLRNLVETLMFFWFIPGRRRDRDTDRTEADAETPAAATRP